MRENVVTVHIFVCLFQRLSLRRQILSTAGLPKLTTPLKTEESERVLSEIPTSPFLATRKPQRKTPIFLLPSPGNLRNKACLVFILFYFMVPWIQKTDNQNMMLLVFQKIFTSLPPADTGNRLYLLSTNSGLWD